MLVSQGLEYLITVILLEKRIYQVRLLTESANIQKYEKIFWNQNQSSIVIHVQIIHLLILIFKFMCIHSFNIYLSNRKVSGILLYHY